MMLIILDKNPEKCVDKLPRSIKFKQLIELCQLVCSAGISNVYKPVKQGRRLQSWIIRNKGWVFQYMVYLKNWCFKNVEMKMETIYKIDKILYDLFISTKIIAILKLLCLDIRKIIVATQNQTVK